MNALKRMTCKAKNKQWRTLISVASISKSLSVIKHSTLSSAIKQKEQMTQKRIQEIIKEIYHGRLCRLVRVILEGKLTRIETKTILVTKPLTCDSLEEPVSFAKHRS